MNFDAAHFFPILPEQIDRARPHVQALLERFERETQFATAEDVFRRAIDRECVIWGYHDGDAFRGLVVTRIHFNVVGKVCSLWACVGDDCMDLITDALAVLERWARDNGCYEMEAVGRKGWSKVLPGYTERAVVLAKRLAEVH